MKHRTGLAHAALLLALRGAMLVCARPQAQEPAGVELP
jgi:hypothetical protein